MNPEAPLALRLSGQLLLGIVRIYNKQIVYLYEDCNATLAKFQQAGAGPSTQTEESARAQVLDSGLSCWLQIAKAGEALQLEKSKPVPATQVTLPEDYQPFGVWADDDLELDLS